MRDGSAHHLQFDLGLMVCEAIQRLEIPRHVTQATLSASSESLMSRDHVTLRLRLKTPVDANALAELLRRLEPELFAEADSPGSGLFLAFRDSGRRHIAVSGRF